MLELFRFVLFLMYASSELITAKISVCTPAAYEIDQSEGHSLLCYGKFYALVLS
jgi:hypothetical protein